MALQVLNIFDQKLISIDPIISDFEQDIKNIPKVDRAFFNALVYGILRWRKSLDWIIENNSKRSIKRIDKPVLNIIRIGLFQIFFMDKVPDYAAIDTSVNMAKQISLLRSKGFINGILRNIVRNKKDILFILPQNCDANIIASFKSFPDWLIKKWINALGKQQTIDLCDFLNQIPSITIRVNTEKTSIDKLNNILLNHVKSIQRLNYSPLALSITGPQQPISEIPEFKKGLFQIQDEASQIITYILNPQPGEKILDACAGKGGKTGHIAQIMNNNGTIVAVDKSKKKLDMLLLEMKKFGFTNVKTKKLTWPDSNYRDEFDRILIDSPCSGLGVIRRNPDTKWLRFKKDFIKYNREQIKILSAMAHLLKKGGTIVYCVCSCEPEETTDVIKHFLSNNDRFKLIKKFYWLPDSIKKIINKNGYFISWPHIYKMDGFFAACLIKE